MSEMAQDQLPLRRRGTLEIFDVALKLYKRYFVPLIVWSMVASLAQFAGMWLPAAGWIITIAVAPIAIGSVACCLAAAVHGRDISIKECWNFLFKRYGSVLHVYILCGLIAFILLFALMIVIGVLAYFVIMLFSQLLSSSDAASLLGAVGIVVAALCASVFFACLFAWMGMTPLALCLEGDGKDNGRFLRRTYDLMRGNWWRIFGIVSMVGLAILGLIIILMGMASVIIGLGTLKEITSGHLSPDDLSKLIAGYVGSFSLVSILWSPFYYLALGLQYLDLRVRKEALDLEWAVQEEPAELA
jgi:hypothetical protein